MRLGKKQSSKARVRPGAARSDSKQPSYSYYKTYGGGSASSKPEKSIDLGAKTNRARMLPTIIAVIVIVASLLFSLTLSTSPALDFVSGVEASPYRNNDEYAKKAQELLGSSLRNQTKLAIDTHTIEQQMLTAFPEIAAIQLRMPVLGRKPTFIVDIRKPAMILVTNTQSFILDDTGTAVAEMRNLPADVRKDLLVLQDQSGLSTGVGKQAVTSSTVRFIAALETQFKSQSLGIEQLTLPTVANELDVRFKGVSYYLKTDTSGDARLQAGSFFAVRDHLAGQGITPAEYIDVRVEEKVFYK